MIFVQLDDTARFLLRSQQFYPPSFHTITANVNTVKKTFNVLVSLLKQFDGRVHEPHFENHCLQHQEGSQSPCSPEDSFFFLLQIRHWKKRQYRKK